MFDDYDEVMGGGNDDCDIDETYCCDDGDDNDDQGCEEDGGGDDEEDEECEDDGEEGDGGKSGDFNGVRGVVNRIQVDSAKNLTWIEVKFPDDGLPKLTYCALTSDLQLRPGDIAEYADGGESAAEKITRCPASGGEAINKAIHINCHGLFHSRGPRFPDAKGPIPLFNANPTKQSINTFLTEVFPDSRGVRRTRGGVILLPESAEQDRTFAEKIFDRFFIMARLRRKTTPTPQSAAASKTELIAIAIEASAAEAALEVSNLITELSTDYIKCRTDEQAGGKSVATRIMLPRKLVTRATTITRGGRGGHGSGRGQQQTSKPPLQSEKFIENIRATYFRDGLMTSRQIEIVLFRWFKVLRTRNLSAIFLTQAEIAKLLNDSTAQMFARAFAKTPAITTAAAEPPLTSPCICRQYETAATIKKKLPWCILCLPPPSSSSSGSGCGGKRSSTTNTSDEIMRLYNVIKKNPFAFPAIDFETATGIYRASLCDSEAPIPDEFEFCGKLVRELSSIHLKSACKVFPSANPYHQLIEKYSIPLQCVYGIVLRLRQRDDSICAYALSRFLIEHECAIYFSNALRAPPRQRSRSQPPPRPYPPLSTSATAPTAEIKLTELQVKAIDAIVNHDELRFVCVTGGPGTGKTTILRQVIGILHSRDKQFRLSSFTGKAVTRIKETTECNPSLACTLDRLIAKFDVFEFEYLIIDEMSMVTPTIFSRFLKVRKQRIGKKVDNLKVVFIGDIDQLPPVDWGNLFSTVIALAPSNAIIRLNENFRIADRSGCGGGDRGSASLLKLFDVVRTAGDASEIRVIADASAMLCTAAPPSLSGTTAAPFPSIQIVEFADRIDEAVVKRVREIGSFIVEPKDVGVFAGLNSEVNFLNQVLRREFSAKASASAIASGAATEGSAGLDVSCGSPFLIGDRVMMTKNVYSAAARVVVPKGDRVMEADGRGSKGEEGGGFSLMNGDTGTVVRVVTEAEAESGIGDDEKLEAGVYVDFDGVSNAKKVCFRWKTLHWQIQNDLVGDFPDLTKMKLHEGADRRPITTGDHYLNALMDREGGDKKQHGVDDVSNDETHLLLRENRGSGIPNVPELLTVDLLKLAFALTVHKSQGSEFKHVIVNVPRRNIRLNFYNRNLLYTAITRAKQSVTIITPGSLDIDVQHAIRTPSPPRCGNMIAHAQMMIAAAAALTGKTRGSGGGGARETRRGFIEVIPEGLPADEDVDI